MTAHPQCTEGHVCQQPSGRECVEGDCRKPAGTWWGPLWCPEHDQERIERIDASLKRIKAEMRRLSSE